MDVNSDPAGHRLNGAMELTVIKGCDQCKLHFAALRAELSWYKKENKQLREKLQTSLNVVQLEKTLRLTLQSFGVLPTAQSAQPSPQPVGFCNYSPGTEANRESYPPRMSSCTETDLFTDQTTRSHATVWEANDDSVASLQLLEDNTSLSSHIYTNGLAETINGPAETIDDTSSNTDHKPMDLCIANSTSIVPQTCTFSSKEELVAGSGVLVDSRRLNEVQTCKDGTYTLMTRSLMQLVFTTEEMSASCVRDKRTGRGRYGTPARCALDQDKVQAIIGYVMGNFPYVNNSKINCAMNQKLVDERAKARNRVLRETRGGMSKVGTRGGRVFRASRGRGAAFRAIMPSVSTLRKAIESSPETIMTYQPERLMLDNADLTSGNNTKEVPTTGETADSPARISISDFLESLGQTDAPMLNFKNKTHSYTVLTRSLVQLVFTKEEMSNSCVRGRPATGKGAGKSPARRSLDQYKVQAIINYVQSHFPAVVDSAITQAMNQKLVDFRSTGMRKNKICWNKAFKMEPGIKLPI